MDILLEMSACLGTIFTAAYCPVTLCFAIFTRPLDPLPMVLPILHGPMVLGSLSSFSLSLAFLSLRRGGAVDCCWVDVGLACCRELGAAAEEVVAAAPPA